MPSSNQRTKRPRSLRAAENFSPAVVNDPRPFFSPLTAGRWRKCSRRRSRLSNSEMEAHGLTHEQPLDRRSPANRAGWRLAAALRRPRLRRRADRPALAAPDRRRRRGPPRQPRARRSSASAGSATASASSPSSSSAACASTPTRAATSEYVTALIKGEGATRPRRRRRKPLQARGRQPDHPGRALDQALEPRRAAPALQRRRSAT